MKKPYQSHNSITVFLVLITYVIWGIMTYFMIADGYFRVTLLLGLVPLGFLAWALVKGAKTISGVRSIIGLSMISWSLDIYDYFLAAFLGQNSCEWIPTLKTNGVLVQLVAVIILLCIAVVLFPIAQRSLRAIRQRERNSPPASGKWSWISFGGVGLASVLREWIRASKNAVAIAIMDIFMFSLSFFVFAVFGMTMVLLAQDDRRKEDEPAPKIPMI